MLFRRTKIFYKFFCGTLVSPLRINKSWESISTSTFFAVQSRDFCGGDWNVRPLCYLFTLCKSHEKWVYFASVWREKTRTKFSVVDYFALRNSQQLKTCFEFTYEKRFPTPLINIMIHHDSKEMHSGITPFEGSNLNRFRWTAVSVPRMECSSFPVGGIMMWKCGTSHKEIVWKHWRDILTGYEWCDRGVMFM